MSIPKRWYNRSEAGEYIRIKPSTMRVWASQGKGPRFYRAGARCIYDVADLDAFVQASEYEADAA